MSQAIHQQWQQLNQKEDELTWHELALAVQENFDEEDVPAYRSPNQDLHSVQPPQEQSGV